MRRLVLPAAAPSVAASDGGLRAAQRVAREQGDCPRSTTTWRRSAPFRLAVLVGVLRAAADGDDQRAFVFDGGRSFGTDAGPSAQPPELRREATTIALSSVPSRRSDPLCRPAGGGTIVRFRRSGRPLVALDPIPSADPRAPLHR